MIKNIFLFRSAKEELTHYIQFLGDRITHSGTFEELELAADQFLEDNEDITLEMLPETLYSKWNNVLSDKIFKHDEVV